MVNDMLLERHLRHLKVSPMYMPVDDDALEGRRYARDEWGPGGHPTDIQMLGTGHSGTLHGVSPQRAAKLIEDLIHGAGLGMPGLAWSAPPPWSALPCPSLPWYALP